MSQEYKGISVSIPLRYDDENGPYKLTKTIPETVKQNFKNLILTIPGERCLVGSTKIPLLNGTEMEIKDLVGRSEFWIYSFDIDRNAVVAGKATAYKTLENAQLIEIILDNNEKVRCTPDHLWLLRNGEYRKAEKLCPGDSLMPLYRSLNTSKYERVYQPYLGDYRETHLCVVEEKRLTGTREVVHHKDLNKRNNAPDNLQWMTCKEHKDIHKKITNAFLIKLNSDPNFKMEWLAKQKEGLKKYYETHSGHRKGVTLSEDTCKKLCVVRNKFYNTDEGRKCKEKISQKLIEYFETNEHPMKGKKHTEDAKEKMKGPRPSMRGDNNPSKRPEVIEKIKETWRKKTKNHKVLSIKKLDYKEDCFDLKVEKYHNFAVSAGAFVHNCMNPNFGVGVHQLLFENEQDDVTEILHERIYEQVQQYLPFITIIKIDTKTEADQHIFRLKISYFINNLGLPDELSIVLDR